MEQILSGLLKFLDPDNAQRYIVNHMNFNSLTVRLSSVSFWILSLISAPSHALSKEVQQLVNWETQANAVAARSPDPIKMDHFEIPLDVVEKDFAKDLDPAIKDTLVFQKNGKSYVRWVINPEDTKWHLEVKKFLEEQNLDSKTYQYFTGYKTASRSMIVEDPSKKVSFSVKVSTNVTGGHWMDKKQYVGDSEEIRMASDMIQNISEKVNFKHLLIQDEPLQMGLKQIDQALIVRNINISKKEKRFYLPGFSAVHDKVGREIALLNGEVNPEKFWNENYNKPLGRALAEFEVYFGMSYDSPHSQNFLIELDDKMKPTGKIILRDFGDAYVGEEKLNSLGLPHFTKKWEKNNVLSGREIQATVGIMHGNSNPSWLSPEQYSQWGNDYYKEYDKVFSELTGIPEVELRKFKAMPSGLYFRRSIKLSENLWTKYLNATPCLKGEKTMLDGTSCIEALLSRIKMLPSSCTANIVRLNN